MRATFLNVHPLLACTRRGPEANVPPVSVSAGEPRGRGHPAERAGSAERPGRGGGWEEVGGGAPPAPAGGGGPTICRSRCTRVDRWAEPGVGSVRISRRGNRTHGTTNSTASLTRPRRRDRPGRPRRSEDQHYHADAQELMRTIGARPERWPVGCGAGKSVRRRLSGPIRNAVELPDAVMVNWWTHCWASFGSVNRVWNGRVGRSGSS
jgi:hypothetical protein